jgi:hypothetical protein
LDSTGSLASLESSGPLGFLADLCGSLLARLPGAGRYDVLVLFGVLATAAHLTFTPNLRWFALRGADALDERGLSYAGLAWAGWALLLLLVFLALFDGPQGAALLEGRTFLEQPLASRPGFGGTYVVLVLGEALVTLALRLVARRRHGRDQAASGVGAWHGILVLIIALSRFGWTLGALLLMDAFVLGAVLSELASIVVLGALRSRVEGAGAAA